MVVWEQLNPDSQRLKILMCSQSIAGKRLKSSEQVINNLNHSFVKQENELAHICHQQVYSSSLATPNNNTVNDCSWCEVTRRGATACESCSGLSLLCNAGNNTCLILQPVIHFFVTPMWTMREDEWWEIIDAALRFNVFLMAVKVWRKNSFPFSLKWMKVIPRQWGWC